ncbi:trimeric intracellular cation channel family protein, partial [Serratia sp. IR-2025]
MLLSILYIIGITAEAMTGALAAGRRQMDMFGVIIIASVTAIGGGSVRDMLLGHFPLGWVKHPEYIVIVAIAAIVTTWVGGRARGGRGAGRGGGGGARGGGGGDT